MKNITKEEFEDTKEVIRIRISKKDRQHKGQKKKDRQHNGQKDNVLQNTARSPLKPWNECALEE